MFFTKTTFSAALVAAANAHMVMKSPAPFNPQLLNNSPLDASGSDFPCKFSDSYTPTGGSLNTYELGSTQELSFIGSAVHGGGSCQVVMTYDNPPTKDSVWKVIHSIEGGCPAKHQVGNLPENPAGTDAGVYNFKVPSDIPAGKGVIGWTWFNRIGNREMYMNCGALELTGTGGDKANFDKLPDMVVMNIGSYPKTPEGVDYKFTDPGPSVEDNIGEFGVATCSKDGCQQGDTTGSGSGSGSGSGGSPTTTAAATPTPTPTGGAGGAGGGVFLTVPASSSAVPTSTDAPASSFVTSVSSSAVPTATPIATPTPVPGSGSGSGSGSGNSASGACSTEGMWNCIGGTSFQQCASGTWSAPIAMAAGTKCTPGQSMDLGMIAAGRRVRAFRV